MEASLSAIWKSSSPSELLFSSSTVTSWNAATSSSWGDYKSNTSASVSSTLDSSPTEPTAIRRTDLSSRSDSESSDNALIAVGIRGLPSNFNDYGETSNPIPSSAVTTASSSPNPIDVSTSTFDPISITSSNSPLGSTISYTPWWSTTSSNLYESTGTEDSKPSSVYPTSSSSWLENTSNDPYASSTTSGTINNADRSSSIAWNENLDSATRISSTVTSGLSSVALPSSSRQTTLPTSDDFQGSPSSATLMPSTISTPSVAGISSNGESNSMEFSSSIPDGSLAWNPSSVESYSPSGYTSSALMSSIPSTSSPYLQSATSATPISSSYDWNLDLSTGITTTPSTSATSAWLSGWYSSWFLSSSPTMSPSISEAPTVWTTTTATSSSEQALSPYNTYPTWTPSSAISISQPLQSTITSAASSLASENPPSTSMVQTNTVSSPISTSAVSSLVNTVDTPLSPNTWGSSSSGTEFSTLPSDETGDLTFTYSTTPALSSNDISSEDSTSLAVTTPLSYVEPTASESYNSITSTMDNPSNTPPTTTEGSTIPNLSALSSYISTTSSILPTTSFIPTSSMAATSLSSNGIVTSDSMSAPVFGSSSVWHDVTPMASSSVSGTAFTSSNVFSNPSAIPSSISLNPSSVSSSSIVPLSLSSSSNPITSSKPSTGLSSSSETTFFSSSQDKSSTTPTENSLSSSHLASSSSPTFKSSSSESKSHPSSPVSSTSSVNTGYSVSYGTRTAYYVYTQTYVITASTTTFGTGFPSTVGRPRSASTSFSAPKTIVTQDMGFYNHWSDNVKSHQHPRKGGGNDTGAIVGGVVGGVCGIVGCCLATWIFLRRRRNQKRNTTAPQGFSEEIGNRVGNTSPPETPRAGWEEKPEEHTANNNYIGNSTNENQLFSIFRTKRIPQTQDEDAVQYPFCNQGTTPSRESNDSENPFQDEFNFRGRSQTEVYATPPPVPPPRKMHSNTKHPISSRNISSSRENHSSSASSLAVSSFVSSFQGDYSTFSSGPIRLEPGSYSNGVSEDPDGGFLREVI